MNTFIVMPNLHNARRIHASTWGKGYAETCKASSEQASIGCTMTGTVHQGYINREITGKIQLTSKFRSICTSAGFMQ